MRMAGELWTDYHTPGKRWAGLLSVGGPNETKQDFFSQGSAGLCACFEKGSAQFLRVCSRTYAGTSTDKVYKQWKRSLIAFCLQKIRDIIDRPAGSAIAATLDNGIKKVLG